MKMIDEETRVYSYPAYNGAVLHLLKVNVSSSVDGPEDDRHAPWLRELRPMGPLPVAEDQKPNQFWVDKNYETRRNLTSDGNWRR